MSPNEQPTAEIVLAIGLALLAQVNEQPARYGKISAVEPPNPLPLEPNLHSECHTDSEATLR